MRFSKSKEKTTVTIGVYRDQLYSVYAGEILENIGKYSIFAGKTVNFCEYNYIGDMQDDLTVGKVDFIVLPCRDNRNNVNAHLLEIINSMINRRVVEAGTFYLRVNYSDSKNFSGSPNLVPDTLDGLFGKVEMNFAKDGAHSTDVDFKIFGRSEYKPSNLYKILIACFANGILNKILSFGLLAIPIILIVIAPFMGGGAEQLVTAISAIAVAFLQFTVNLLGLDVKAKQCLIKGYWLYYSFEDGSADNGFVPKGFKTRLLEVDADGESIAISCKFEADDTIFFHTTATAFEYKSSTKIGSGFYEYSANAKNNKGKRAEGVCRFRGEAKNNLPFITMDGWFSSRGTGITGRVKYVRLSKAEYDRLKLSTNMYSDGGAQTVVKFGVYGDVCSNTELAGRTYIEGAEELVGKQVELCYYETLEEMYNDFKELKLNYAIVPEKNRGKSIERNNVFIKNKIRELTSFDMDINYVVASKLADFIIDENTVFLGHPQSLIQCAPYLKGRKTAESSSSSRAAREVKYSHNPSTHVAICNRSAMLKFGLYPVKDVAGDDLNPFTSQERNYTHFAVYRNKKK